MRLALHEPLGRELDQRLADRGAGSTVPLDQVGFDEPLPRIEGTVREILAQRLGDAFDRLPAREARPSLGGPRRRAALRDSGRRVPLSEGLDAMGG